MCNDTDGMTPREKIAFLEERLSKVSTLAENYLDENMVLRGENIRLISNISVLLEKEAKRTDREAEHRRRQLELEELATKDSLTGLLNRPGFDEAMVRYLSAMKRDSSQPATFVFIDLDRFKAVNDLLSHDAGDTLLMKLGHCLKNSLRPNDYIARIGGDEFAVVLKNVGERSVAEHVIEKVRTAVRKITIDGVDPKQLELVFRATDRRYLIDFSAGYFVIKNAQLSARSIQDIAEHDVPKFAEIRTRRGEYTRS